jgi:hypothetical protein
MYKLQKDVSFFGKLSVTEGAKKFPAFYVTQSFITIYTSPTLVKPGHKVMP